MIKAGLCSVTFKNKTPKEIVDIASRAKLSGIEWGSDVHVREGDVKTAQEVRCLTEASGLEVSSYGSYYRLGNGQDFKLYLDSAVALGAKEIRVWAGINPAAYHLFDARRAIVREAKEISRMAAAYGITISTECHAYTLTDSPESLLLLMHEVNEENFCTYWQALFHVAEIEQMRSLEAIHSSGKMTNLHVQYFKIFETKREQRPLSEAYDTWLERLSLLKGEKRVRHALLEFVKDGSEEIFMDDAATLIKLSNEVNSL